MQGVVVVTPMNQASIWDMFFSGKTMSYICARLFSTSRILHLQLAWLDSLVISHQNETRTIKIGQDEVTLETERF